LVEFFFCDDSKASADRVIHSELQMTCSVHVDLILDLFVFIAYTHDTKCMVV